ncbi:MAG: exodeoxyribonuclease III [Candidatus Thermoplasmatota archaeon]|nr:exodeoxyribonuclease III [Candidatus Thermoplasmatota archaeon]MDD5777831.1 exodeoxyribonuclease III [Candidatus Thermoplasmatota archaeon]
MTLTVATWNVNSIRARMDLLLEWLRGSRPDVACLQETKVADQEFPEEAFTQLGYQAAFKGQKTYNGVCILSRLPLDDVVTDFEVIEEDEKRLLQVRAGEVTVIDAYVPHGQVPESAAFYRKIDFLEGLRVYLDNHFNPRDDHLVLVGDFNVAPEAKDVYDPGLLEGSIGFYPREREALAYLRDWGFVDVFRRCNPGTTAFSWWDYRGSAFAHDRGMRLDHIWVSPPLASRCSDCVIQRAWRGRPRPSDHAPVVATFDG